ncbi:AtpZ/AtpI family protein [Swaminathania salitolerans]|uniref:ATP synthase protein I n=1 Tax=Swaminathania salitolerans TaxID=182838 RepID=A0A511BRT4_9PROT|nr:AtpZ/AtpI family protein [Swaminathania salitolerans]GBQ13528.1 ATP synthase F0 subunit iota [Swaminathania salitolerans LMG 21291]GEL02334.1 ATP synthase protein I [Swaminathania salitolerans]
MGAQDDLNVSSQTDKGAESFDRRLAEAEARMRGKSVKDDAATGTKDGNADYSAFGLAMRLGTEMVAALIVGVVVGYGLDRLCGTKPVLLILFSLAGGASGMLNVWRAVRNAQV